MNFKSGDIVSIHHDEPSNDFHKSIGIVNKKKDPEFVYVAPIAPPYYKDFYNFKRETPGWFPSRLKKHNVS